MRSLQGQLQRNTLLTLAVALAALLALVNLGVKQLTQDYIASRLQHDGESIIAALTQDENGNWQVDSSRLPAVYSRVNAGHYFRVLGNTGAARNAAANSDITTTSETAIATNTNSESLDKNGAQQNSAIDIRSRSLWDHVPDTVVLAPGKTRVDYARGLEQEQWLTWSQGIRKGNTDLTIWVAEDISELLTTRHQYAIAVGAILMVTILLLMLVQHWILKRGFRQLESVRANIQAIHSGQFAAFDRQLPLEVKPLAQEIERLLERLQQRVSRSRNALGNLAHELKRPLQQLRLLSDTVPAQQREEWLQTLNSISHLVERELKRARIVGVSSPGRHTVLADEVPPLIALLQKIHPHCTLRADYDHHLILPQDRDDLLELLGNLLDNACKYGNGIVLLNITAHLDHWRIQVEDNGKGIPAAELDAISERGVRLDETRAGNGLGLAICKDIVTSYQGAMQFENLPQQAGFRVTVTLPMSLLPER